jgi:arylsulfatase A-like enzyme
MKCVFDANVAVLFLLPMLALLCEDSAADERKPNFVYIFTDDQRWDALGVVQREQGEKARFPWLRTPNLDRLAAEGVRFRNAFVVNSLCAPSRATLVTGQYGHVNGVVNNHTPHPPGNLSLPALLRPAGYVSAYVGKWHHGSQSGQRPGFDYSASFVGQGKYFDCPVEVNGVTTPTKGFIDDVTTDYAADFMRKNQDKPFLLILGYKTCHGPFTPPPRHEKTYEGDEARRVPNLGVRPPYRLAEAAPAGAKKKIAAIASDSPTVPTNLNMFRGITAIDDNVGKLLQLLDELQLTEDTVVCFSSDNGYYLGEHGLGDKRSAYEEAMRIPMLVRYPRLITPGSIENRMVLNVDPAATILDLAGVAAPPTMHGRSWKPIFEEKSEFPWRDSFFYCYFYERGFATPTTTAVRTESAKLIKYPGHDDWTEMFNLRDDPYETKNLANEPAYAELRKRLEAEYEEQSKAIGFHIPDFADKPPADGSLPGRGKPKVKQPARKKKNLPANNA